ncbi:MAG: response regulator [Elusimicrobia bacterium]|nr:response regulator [Elusimicrobiota bacterium]MDE2237345.1 response regulator [Elusimicrobiota bacterium]MDE2426869.1 response regulator [Elusimicrobiota bacterium]
MNPRDQPTPGARGPWPRILAADDDPDILQLAVWLVERKYPDAEIKVAENARQALELLRNFAPDLLLADLRTPKLGGLELCQRVGADPWLSRTKIIALSGRKRSRKKAFFSSAAVEFFGKPLKPRSVRAAASRLLGKGRGRPASRRAGTAGFRRRLSRQGGLS